MKIFVSIPMNGKSDYEIAKDIEKAEKTIKEKVSTDEQLEFANGLLDKYHEDDPLKFLSQALRIMSDCDAVFFVDGWERSRGCQIEHTCAVAYGIKTIYEKDGFEDFEKFITVCRSKIVEYYKKELGQEIGYNNTYIVWLAKELKNFKCLASTTVPDSRYFEFSYNGYKEPNETYLDCYTKELNEVIK